MATDLPPITVYPPGQEPVSIDTTEAPVAPTVDLPTVGVPTQPPAPEVAKQRTGKVQQGLGDIINRSTQSIYQDFLDGKEELLRTQAATAIDYKKAMDRQQAIQDMAAKQGGPLDATQVQRIMDPFAPNNIPTDPSTVIERAYATKYVSSLNTAAGYISDTNPLSTAQAEVPVQAQQTVDDANELLTKNQYILSRMQDIQQGLVQNQSWAGYLTDQAKQMFQPYVEYKERGNVDGLNFSGIGLGSNLQEQSNNLYRKPFPEFKKTFDTAMEYLSKDNPSLAVQFANSMLGQDTFDKTLNNTFTALAVPDLAAGIKGGVALTKKIVAYNQIRKAAKDIVSSAARDPNATEATKLEGAGVVGEAAVQKVSSEVVAALNGQADPTAVSRSTLMSTWQEMQRDFAANPGTYLSREEYTRLHDGFAKPGEDLLNRIDTMARVERTPVAVASDNVNRAYKDKIRSDFKGPPGMLGDTEGPYLEPTSHTYWYKNKLLDYNGEQFADAETAKGRAQSIGMSDPIIEGTEAAKLYIPESAAKRLESVETNNGVTKFYTDGGVEVQASPTPRPGHVPVTTETSGEQTFKTSKGSSYVVHEDGTTTRNKALRPEHPGDQGAKPRSTETFYITEDEYKSYKNSKDRGDKSFPDKRGTTLYTDIANDVSILPKRQPEKGLVPVEVWNDGKSRSIHFGNTITEVKNSGTSVKFHPTLTEESARIEQQGLGFHIVQWVPMKESDHVIRDLMIKTTGGELIPEAVSTSSATGIDRVKNSLLGWVRNSEDTLSFNESAQRKAATYAKSNVEQWAHELNKPLEKLKNTYPNPRNFFGSKISKKQIFQEFERTLDASRKLDDPATGEKGYFFKSAGELQDFYNRSFNRDPSALETEAYFNYVKVKEGERMFSEIAEFRNRAREGYAQQQLNVLDQDGKTVSSGFFDGRQTEHFPGGDDFMLIMGDIKGGEDIKKLGNINTKQLEEMKRQWSMGEAKVLELYDIDHHPLNGFTDLIQDQRIRYVFSRNVETKPIQFNHVNKRGGAHFEWDYDHYIKQADVRPQRVSGKTLENIYVGDKTVMPIKTRALGNNVVKLWNEAHELIKNGDWNGVKPIAAKLGIDYKEFTGWYHPGRDANGKSVRPMLDANEPLTVVSRGKNINNIDNSLRERYQNFKDGTKTGSLNNFKVAYNTERHSDGGLRTINDVGTKDNPIFAHQPAEFVDPITTMNRALNRSINSLFMDDYKLYGVEHWLREAEPYLEAKGGVKEIRSSPFAHFIDPKFKSDIDYTQKQNLLSNKYKIQSFIGIPSKFDAWVHSFTEHLADSAYERYGPEESRTIGQKARTIAPIWMLHRLTNPVDFIRSATFNFKLGIFNPAQFLVQAQTHSLIWALEPRHGTAGTYAMLLHGWSKVNRNPAILEALDKYATRLSGFGSRFKPGEFTEAREWLERSGFENVAGEYANLSKAYLPTTNFVQNDLNKGLRLGQTPFRLGEQSTRVTAWYTAFREFREANPTVKITNLELQKILSKADLLTVNMSRASSSVINHGVFSLSTQFLSYQIKLAELFWSKRIGETATDRVLARARILTGFAALYGLPNAVGVTGAPISDNIRTHLMDDLGYIPGEKWLSTMVNEGFPAWSYAIMTGHGDLQKGMIPNVGDRFGSQGWSNIKQALRSNIPWWQAIGGAGVSTMSKFVSDGLDPFYQGALSWARGDTGDERFTIRSADLVEPLKQISTYSAGAKWWTALQTGKWLSNNESYVTDVDALNATILALTGMSPQEQDDMFLRNQMIQGETDAQKEALKDFIKDWRRGIQSKENGDDEQGNAYHRNAMSRLTAVGYPREKILSAIAIANKGYEKAIDNSNYNSWSKGDASKQQQRLDQFKRQLDLNDKRSQ